VPLNPFIGDRPINLRAPCRRNTLYRPPSNRNRYWYSGSPTSRPRETAACTKSAVSQATGLDGVSQLANFPLPSYHETGSPISGLKSSPDQEKPSTGRVPCEYSQDRNQHSGSVFCCCGGGLYTAYCFFGAFARRYTTTKAAWDWPPAWQKPQKGSTMSVFFLRLQHNCRAWDML
jgi:hypothetical protein